MFTLFTPPLPQNVLCIPQFGPSNFDTPYYYQMLNFRPLDVPEMQVCNSFREGYCKYGGSCRFLHVFQMQNGDCMVLNPPPSDEVMSSASLKQLEIELVELLRCTRGIPVSVSSLPILYFDRYRKVLQVEGYQMEIHRLIARMTTTSIRLTNKPHRRQSIILEENMHRYVRFRAENGHQLQVYLTFPPESTLNEQDVLNYFNNFGPVQKVRIPSQVQRMFGFVAFVYPEMAALVLTKTKPHYICGSQVLVKPFRENEDKVHDIKTFLTQNPSKILQLDSEIYWENIRLKITVELDASSDIL
ncbi:hypothetical protein SASPL_132323 [Salvia splendens]|uniref:Uncharacterized protein n=1 Tax=Salvia splendens TaxID=180675 RepID=A0A8X8ZH49_SALSN|nr:hypothetical protein SASPL_132323 [Salvia splendens]